MKKDRKCRNKNMELYRRLDEKFDIDDDRFWGLFKIGKRKNSFSVEVIDPKRFQKTTRHSFTDEQLKIINTRKTHYFFPKKRNYSDYNCNILLVK